jgi:uncharacterized protein
MNPVVHFEMPYDDAGRMAKFYKSAFKWKMKKMGKKMGDYVLATTAESASDGRPEEPGSINGGFFPKKAEMPEQHPSVVIAVDNITKAMAKVNKAGGQVLGEPMDIPGVGAYVSFMDTEGNRASLLQPMRAMEEKDKGRKKEKGSKKKKAVAAKGKSAAKGKPAAASRKKKASR